MKPSTRPQKPLRVKETLITIVVVIVVVAGLVYAVSSMHKSTGRHGLRGTIIKKEFIPLQETQISIGSQGVHRRESEGEHKLLVRVEETGREYVIWVDPLVFRQHKVGDTYFFTRPPRDDESSSPAVEDTSVESQP